TEGTGCGVAWRRTLRGRRRARPGASAAEPPGVVGTARLPRRRPRSSRATPTWTSRWVSTPSVTRAAAQRAGLRAGRGGVSPRWRRPAHAPHALEHGHAPIRAVLGHGRLLPPTWPNPNNETGLNIRVRRRR